MEERPDTLDDDNADIAAARRQPKKRWLFIAKICKWILFSGTVIGGTVLAAQSCDGDNSGMTVLILAVTVIGALSEFLIFNVLFNLANEVIDIQRGVSNVERIVTDIERKLDAKADKNSADDKKRLP